VRPASEACEPSQDWRLVSHNGCVENTPHATSLRLVCEFKIELSWNVSGPLRGGDQDAELQRGGTGCEMVVIGCCVRQDHDAHVERWHGQAPTLQPSASKVVEHTAPEAPRNLFTGADTSNKTNSTHTQTQPTTPCKRDHNPSTNTLWRESVKFLPNERKGDAGPGSVSQRSASAHKARRAPLQ
jgi:hypothetical protein